MKNNSLFTNILGVLIAAGVIGIYTQINDLKEDVTLVRMELVQYHTIVGHLQGEIEDLQEVLKDDRHIH